jgi:uncharacterized protein
VPDSPPDRIRTLDLIRGVAVLGILAVNVASFAAPTGAGYSPNLPVPSSMADNWAFGFTLVFFEGKMRALFSILFGASLLLFIERQDQAGHHGTELQVRRLAWLALFGWLHFLLLWDGDILFLYASVGLGALIVRRTSPLQLVVIALLLFTVWQAWGSLSWTPSAVREAQVAAGTANPTEQAEHAKLIAARRADDRIDRQVSLSSWSTEVAFRQGKHPAYPIAMLANVWGETLSYVMLGMALLKNGFFAGGWSRRRLTQLAIGGTALGLGLTALFALWAHPRGYPELAMHLAIGYGLSFPHLLTALGYAALLVLAAPGLLASALGKRLEAAGRMAFTNYIACTVMMCGLFYGWGLGLFGQVGAAGQWLAVLGAWALMLGWSQPWLARFRQGPLEWLWRCLTAWQLAKFRR